jgi:carbonic anhydrase
MDHPPRYSRREFVQLAGVSAAGLAVTGAGPTPAAPPPPTARKPAPAPKPDEVLRRLLAGNDRFVKGKPANPRRKPEDFRALAEGQNPVAVIIGCSDSRVPPELLFDQGVGDLFVVRVAGNVVSGAGAVVKGSVEYAVAELNVPLIMVLGHSNCGAVKSAVKHLEAGDALPGAINDLVKPIKLAVARVKGRSGDKLANAIRANVEMGVARLKTLKPVLAGPVKKGQVKVVGAAYDLRTGRVKVLG